MQRTQPLHVFRSTFLPALTALTILASACSSTGSDADKDMSKSSATAKSGHAEITDELTAKATVVSVDKSTRMITLRREDGKMISVSAGPDVRNFDQINAGDTLRVRYKETLSVMQTPAGTTAGTAEAALASGRAKAGAMPGGGVGVLASARVKIESVDKEKNIVVYSLSGGELATVRAQRPEGKEFIQGLKVGDVVQIDYAVSVALSVEKL